MEESKGKSLVRIKWNSHENPIKYGVYIDEIWVGEINNEDESEFLLEPGPHRLYLKKGWSRSGIIQIETKPGQEYVLVCGYPLNTGLTLFYILAILSVPFILNLTHIVISPVYNIPISVMIMLSIVLFITSFIPSTQVYLRRDFGKPCSSKLNRNKKTGLPQ